MSDAMTLTFNTPDPDAPPAATTYRKWAMILLGLAVIGWIIVGWVVMPHLIDAAYHGKHVPVLSKMFEHKEDWPIEHYQAKFRKIAIAGLIGLIGPSLLLFFVTTKFFAERIVGVARPGTLGAIRVVVSCILFWIALFNNPHKVVDIPTTERKPMGVITMLYNASPAFSKLPTNSTELSILNVATIITLGMCVIGFRTRFALIASAFLYLLLAGIPRSYYTFNHSGIVPWYCLVVLCFTRCGDGFSVDRLIKQWKGQYVPPLDVPEARYAWGRHLVWVVIAVPYVCAGMSKLFNGPHNYLWWQGTNLQRILYADAFREDWVDHARLEHMAMMPVLLFTISGFGTLFVELGMGLTIFSKWVRRILPPCTAMLHVSIVVLQKIPFFDLMWIQLVFWDWTPARRWISDKLNAKLGKLQVYYDPRSTAQARWARILPGLDLFDRLSLVESPDEMSMRVGRNGADDRTGASAAFAIAKVLPLGWLVLPVLVIPAMASAIGRLTSLNDSRGQQTEKQISKIPAFSPWRRNLAACSVVGLICLILGGWTVRVESYPLTSWQMFSDYDDSGVVKYYRVFELDEAGNTSVADLKNMSLGDNRYRAMLKQSFVTRAGRDTAVRVLTYCAKYWNKKAPPGQRVDEFRIVCRQWDFKNNREDPNLGVDGEWFKLDFDPTNPDKAPVFTQSSQMPEKPPTTAEKE